MKKAMLKPPIIGAIAMTRVLLGLGAGLLLGKRISETRRRTLGWTLFGVGAASTVPLAFTVFRQVGR